MSASLLCLSQGNDLFLCPHEAQIPLFHWWGRLPCLSQLQVQLPIKASTCYREKVELFTNSRGGGRERERGRKKLRERGVSNMGCDFLCLVWGCEQDTINDPWTSDTGADYQRKRAPWHTVNGKQGHTEGWVNCQKHDTFHLFDEKIPYAPRLKCRWFLSTFVHV